MGMSKKNEFEVNLCFYLPLQWLANFFDLKNTFYITIK